MDCGTLYPETDVSRLAGFPASEGRQSSDCESGDYAIELMHGCLAMPKCGS